MDDWFVALFSFLSLLQLNAAQTGVCYTQTRVSVVSYRSTSYYTSYDCGIWGFGTCYSTYYTSQSFTAYMLRPQFGCCGGYRQLGGLTCIPICSQVCANGGTCTAPNTCSCTAGWTGNDCQTDVDECASGTHNCDQTCTNTAGSFTCSCNSGYTLFTDGRTCKDYGSQTNAVDKVECNYQQEACTCRENFRMCDFSLVVEELQTFTSYRTTSETPGATYFYDTSGYVNSLDDSLCPPQTGTDNDSPSPTLSPSRPPECNSICRSSTGSIANEQGFRDMSCSVPMTVDGRTYRLFIAVNGRIPGPTLIVSEDQIVRVKVTNRLTSEGITIHWHGMHQRGTPWMDGVASLSQIPIVPGASFDYIFEASPAGTHWYHSHLGAQRTDGLFGGLIVREKFTSKDVTMVTEAYSVFEDMPEEHTLTLLDWQRESSLNLFVQIHSTLGFYPGKDLGVVPNTRPVTDPQIPGGHDLYYRSTGADGIEVGPVPYWSGLINGRGWYDSNTFSVLSSFDVTSGMSYRFRLIGAQSLFAYRFEIVAHKLKVIATDGQFVMPEEVDYIIIHSGERYDFILDADQSNGNYLIRATTLEMEPSDMRPHTAEAILHYEYEGARDLDPKDRYVSNSVLKDMRQCTSNDKCKALNCPFKAYPFSENTDCIIIDDLTALFTSEDLPTLRAFSDDNRIKFFNFGFEGQSLTSAINGRNFLPPPTPYQVYSGQYEKDVRDDDVNTCSKCTRDSVTMENQAELCTCTHVVKLFSNEDPERLEDKSVMMVFSAVGLGTRRDFAHPVHLHGHSFYVVYVGHGILSNELFNNLDVDCRDDQFCFDPKFRDVPSDMTTDMSSGMESDMTSDTILNSKIPQVVRDKFNNNGRLANNTVRKDTVIVPAGGYVVVAFKADNPGYWFLHCHIEVHQLEGMAVIIQEYDDTRHNFNLPKVITKVGNFKWTHDEFLERLESSALEPGWSFKYIVFSFVLAMGSIMALNTVY